MDLSQLAPMIRERCKVTKTNLANGENPTVALVYLAAKFHECVHQGGFGKFLYNMQGGMLPETQDMLLHFEAERALSFFVRAIDLCSADRDAYHDFLDGDYAEPSKLKDDLLLLSMEYLKGDPFFVEEAADGINKLMPVVKVWLEPLFVHMDEHLKKVEAERRPKRAAKDKAKPRAKSDRKRG